MRIEGTETSGGRKTRTANSVEVLNRQRRRDMDRRRWQLFAARVMEEIGLNGEMATVVFVSDEAIRKLNREFRGRDEATDVLSFPLSDPKQRIGGEPLGDVVISVERAARQAAENGLDFDREIAQLILHGLLHLCGYDHETDDGQMNRLELRLRRRLGII
ncbi:rRNA maturation RNase YbeY [Pyrinomonas sp.]|uniref:rRNA maturation RNase YbeY n=1 Tax=Pyrinomonas sp. TaxID=2080306 RepID=UPI00331B07A8